MLLVPIHKKVDWRHPPLVTLLLVLANVLVFVLFQLDDDRQLGEAVDYYQESGLAQLELEPAIAYAEWSNDYELQRALRGAQSDGPAYWVIALQTNTGFMAALQRGEVVHSTESFYEEWRSKRASFDAYYEAVTYIHYGLRTAQPSLVSLISHMFLHADFWHLFGNMLFLFAVGMLVEMTVNRRTYLLSYLLAGFGSAAFDFIFRGDELIPGIGASGAIAGLMGAYAVLYGMKRIRFFYFIGVYFDYARMPAIVLLPLWLGNELLQMYLNPGSNVNFLAHVGGLVSGGMLAMLIRRYATSYNLEHVEQEEAQQKNTQELQRARDLMAAFKPESALPILRRLHMRDPDNREVLTRAYECSRIAPAGDEYHALAHEIFSLVDDDAATDLLIRETFSEYLRLARPRIRLTPNLVCTLAGRFVRQQAMAEAERLVQIILKNKLACPQGQQVLQAFIRLLAQQGREEERLRYLRMLPNGVAP